MPAPGWLSGPRSWCVCLVTLTCATVDAHVVFCHRNGFRRLFVGAAPHWGRGDGEISQDSDVVREWRHAGLGLI